MAVVGFDFGTTNSLVSLVVANQVINFLQDNRPIPSVVSFAAGDVVVGRKAHDQLSAAGLGIQGSIVRSPKTLLGRDEVFIDGVQHDPVQIVTHLLEHVRHFVLSSNYVRDVTVDEVVATIPVNMEGHRRALLRQAFQQSGMRVVQFVHEPLAALYGFLRASQNTNDLVKRYDGKLLLVFDWGGGTLDLTLCRVIDGLLVQVANDGTEDVGGDIFDEELRNEVEKRVRAANQYGEDIDVLPEARKRLLHECEKAKINLSKRENTTLYVDAYFDVDGDASLSLKITRQDLYDIIGHLVKKGISRIERLLEREGYSSASVELCLATGGMANMPIVNNRLNELFGPARVHISSNSATAIAEGAAWVAHDKARLHLAKNVELVLARNSYMTLLPAGTAMPVEGERSSEDFALFCVDPSDGHGKFSLVSPNRPGPSVMTDDKRRTLCNLVLKVDAKADPFKERLVLNISVNEDLVLFAKAWSTNHKAYVENQVHDLEFALATPGATNVWLLNQKLINTDDVQEEKQAGGLAIRSNIAAKEDVRLVPGELYYKINPFYFRVEKRPPQYQVDEYLYYQPCAICKLPSNHPSCNCAAAAVLPAIAANTRPQV